MSVRFITDSSSDMRAAVRDRATVIPMLIRFGDREYRDGVDITTQAFYEKLVSSEELPTTSQIPPAVFETVFRKAVENGDEVVCLPISSGLSGTYQSACIAAAEFPGKVFVVDGLTVALSAGILLDYGMTLADKGLSAREIAEEMTRQRDRVKLVAVVDTLEYLKKGGRVSATVAFAGGLLNIKPIIAVEGGKVVMLSKARGGKQINAAMMKEVENYGGIDCRLPIMFAYSGTDDTLLRKFMEEEKDAWSEYHGEQTVRMIGATVGTHAGPGAAAIAFFAAE